MKILYVMGFSRSGSTLLDILFSDHPGIFGSGELMNLIGAMDVSHNYCACGQPSSSCPLWRKVRRKWARTVGDDVALQYPALQARLERVRNLPRYRRPHDQNDALGKYLVQSRALFDAIAEASGATTIVDSSKAPVRALALSRMQGVDFRVIHLVRDVRGVACSTRRPFKKNREGGIMTEQPGMKPSVTAGKWMVINAAANRVRARLGSRAMLVRYEDLVNKPLATLERLSRFAGVDWSSTARKLGTGGEFSAEHMIEGNRLRMQKRIELKQDMRWRKELSRLHQAVLPLVTAPVAWPYGYRP
ncbi:MAG: sulfotransferase family protein [Rhodanobacteraceae bacterium]